MESYDTVSKQYFDKISLCLRNVMKICDLWIVRKNHILLVKYIPMKIKPHIYNSTKLFQCNIWQQKTDMLMSNFCCKQNYKRFLISKNMKLSFAPKQTWIYHTTKWVFLMSFSNYHVHLYLTSTYYQFIKKKHVASISNQISVPSIMNVFYQLRFL